MKDEHSIRFLVSGMTPRMYTSTDVALELGVSLATVLRWRRTGVYKPSKTKKFGKVIVHLYSSSDINKMRALCTTQRPGRKPNGTVSHPVSKVAPAKRTTPKRGKDAPTNTKKPHKRIPARRGIEVGEDGKPIIKRAPAVRR